MKLKNRLPLKIISFILLVLGSYVLCGWFLHQEAMVRVLPNTVAMGFNTALLFIVAGLCLYPIFNNRVALRVQGMLPWVMVVLASVILTEHSFDISLGVDWPSLHALVKDGNPRPGRVSPNASLAFLLSGIAFLLFAHTTINKFVHIVLALMIGAVALIGLTASIGYLLDLETMYRLAKYNRMAAPTAIGMTLVGLGLWLRLPQIISSRENDIENPDQHIIRTAAIVLTIVTLLTGLIGFSVLKKGFEDSMSDAMLRTTKNNAALFDTIIHQKNELANIIASRPALQKHLQRINEFPQDRATLDMIETAANSFKKSDVTGLRLINNKGEDITTLGTMVRLKAAMAIPLQGTENTALLLWDNGFVLWTQKPIMVEDQQIATLIIEQKMDTLTQIMQESEKGSGSTDTLICGRDGNDALCFPSRFYHANARIPMYTDGNLNPAIPHALMNQQGVMTFSDLRGVSVLAGYSPIGNLGLVLEIKIDTIEFYKPIRDRLNLLVGLLFLMILIATYILRRQVQPLAQRLHQDHQRMQIIIDSSHEAFIEMDENGVITDWNSQAERTFGWSRKEALGCKLADLILPPTMVEMHNQGMKNFLANGESKMIGKRAELPAIDRNGKQFIVEVTISAIQSEDHYSFTAFLHDISERKEDEAALQAEKEWLRVTLNSIGDGVITTDTFGNISYLNPVAETMTGWTNEEAAGLPLITVFDIVNEITGEVALNPVEQVLRSQRAAGLAENTMLVQRGGTHIPIEDSASPILNTAGDIIGVVLVFHDVTQARIMAAEMTFQAKHDSLTGLINRREFERRLEHALQTGQTEHKEHTLLYLDLDQFKIVNDTCGHMAGDELLRQLTTLLQEKLRKSDTLARLGGDEFGVLLESCTTEPAKTVAEQLRKTVEDFHFVWLDKAFPVGVSIGLVTFSNGGILLSDVLRMADAACYAAKEKGRNRIQVYTAEDEELARRSGEMGWISRIRKALDDNRFVLYSQRILALGQDANGEDKDNNEDHYELLIRMLDDNNDIVPPMAFIPAAERYGLMPQLDRWVIRTAFAQFASRHANHSNDANESNEGNAGNAGNAGKHTKVTCSINLSGKSICDENFFAFVLEQFVLHKVPPQSICFEITETAAIANLNQAATLIRDLRAIGCRFSLDDFGSGMSSFAYLKHLHVDYLKIDGSFVKDMIEDPIDHAMVASIHHIGHVMGIQTIAEFVENDAIKEALNKIGINYAQGYGIEKPRPAWDK